MASERNRIRRLYAPTAQNSNKAAKLQKITEDDIVGKSAPVIILSDGLWKRRFGSDAQIIGKTITLCCAPRQYTEGEEGEAGHFSLELRTIADAGLVGYPNAGKSTLLRQISAARPRVAAYPFTTLHPIIGVVEFSGYRRATIADIPGLIEGAHRGLGLGHEFLRHITRCRIFLFVIDVAGSEGRNPVEDLQQLRKELDLYDPLLSQRPWFVIANKMDLPCAEENLSGVRKKFPKIDIVPISAAKGEGIEKLKEKLEKWLEL